MNIARSSRCLAMILMWCLTDMSAWNVCAQEMSGQTSESWKAALRRHADQVNEAPIPPPLYLRRRWRWLESQSQQEQRISPPHPSVPTSTLERLQRELWSRLGQATNKPLYESPQERDDRRAEMDLETRGTPILPQYTHEFIPAIYPHKRMTSWNKISEEGDLEVEIGSLTEIESIEMPEVLACIEGSTSPLPSLERSLAISEGMWVRPQQLDLDCVRGECLRQGSACFMGVFSIRSWRDPAQPRGVASVSPEQSLVSASTRNPLILSQDDAGNFYISTLPGTRINQLDKISVLISAPRTYFSGAWRSPLPLGSLSDHPDLELPDGLRREALALSAQLLGLDSLQSYESMIYRLAEYFRSFRPGEFEAEEVSVYRNLMVSQIGVCRHRSYAFMVTARALGIPTRYVTNQVHAFVEVLDPSNRWRRIDLGGEGIAPEDKTLTKDLQSSERAMLDRSYKPDDGLPRPEAYLSDRSLLSNHSMPLNREDKSVPQEGKHSAQVNESSTASNTVLGQESDVNSDGPSKAEQVLQDELRNLREERSETTESDTSSRTRKGHQRVDEGCPHSITLPQAPRALEGERMLNELNIVLARPREELTRGSANKISLRTPKIKRIHRCDELELRGRVRLKPQGQRRKSSRQMKDQNLWVLGGLKSLTDGRSLYGWGRLDRRGFFKFSAQIPSRIKPGDYQLFVYLPTQGDIRAGWSELER